jgi:pilus assembly protein CpaF
MSQASEIDLLTTRASEHPNSTLQELDALIKKRIDALPSVDTMTLSRPEFGAYEENRQIKTIVSEICKHAKAEIAQRMHDEYFAAGPLEKLFLDPLITEIIVNGGDSIWYEKSGRLFRAEDCFLSALSYRNFIVRLGREAGLHANLDCPFADGQWRGCRVHLIIPPAAGDQTVLTLRRHPKSPWTLESLEALGWATSSATATLKSLITERKNFLVVGATGSGKTSVLNACLQQVPNNERSLLIEDTSELCVPNGASTKLLTRKDPQALLKEVNQSDLVRQALRMRPDRIVMGEIRGPEAKDLLMAFATGHSGCMGTLHADSARQALIRLEMLIQLGAAQWSLHAVRTLILLSLHAIVVVEKTKEGLRRLGGVYRISSLEEIGFLVEKTA